LKFVKKFKVSISKPHDFSRYDIWTLFRKKLRHFVIPKTFSVLKG